MTISHFLHWLLESLNLMKGSVILIVLVSFHIQFYILAHIFLLLYIFTFFKIL